MPHYKKGGRKKAPLTESRTPRKTIWKGDLKRTEAPPPISKHMESSSIKMKCAA